MRVAFISRATLFTMPGGDTRQMVKTAEHLRTKGVEVDIKLTTDDIAYGQYDLLHFFNIIRPADIIGHIENSGKPYVISPIFVEYGTVNEKGKGMISRTVSKLLSADQMSYLKSIARWLINGEAVKSKKYLLMGHRRSVIWIAKHAECFLPNSENEMKRFSHAYSLQCKYRVVPNGVDTLMSKENITPNEEYRNAIICIARFEPLKNQLSLIKALNNTPYKLFLHGKPSSNHQAYYRECLSAAAGNVKICDWLEGEALYSIYAAAKVHVLPSYFETTGLVSLEAAAMGCNIVVTDRGDQRDYFKDDAWYCDPDDIGSIRKAVDAAYAAPYNNSFRERILKDYTWDRAAEETLKAYKDVLKL